MSAHEEVEQEKEVIRKEFKHKIEEMGLEIQGLTEEIDKGRIRYQGVVEQLDEETQRVKVLESENKQVCDKLYSTEGGKAQAVKEMEESIFRLNKELKEKVNKIHQQELEKEKLQKRVNEDEKAHKYNISLLEKRLKDASTAADNKVKQAVAQSVEASQKALKLEETLRSVRIELSHKEEELDKIYSKFDELSHQHQCLVKESEDREDYIHIIKSKLQRLSSKKLSVIKSVTSAVSSKCKQIKEELAFVKKCYKEEIQLMNKHFESSFGEITTFCRNLILRIKDSCIKKLQESREKSDEELFKQITQLKSEFKHQLDSLSERCEIGEERYLELEQELKDTSADNRTLVTQMEDLKSIIAIKELSISKLQSKIQLCEKEIDKHYDRYVSELGQEFEKQQELDKLELSAKLQKMREFSDQKLARLKATIESMHKAHSDETSKIKEEYQEKIDGLFKESYSQMQKLSEADTENEVLCQRNKSLESEVNRLKELIHRLLTDTQTEVPKDSSIEHGLSRLSASFIEKDRLIESYKRDNEKKNEEIRKISEKAKSIREQSQQREDQIKDQLNRSREELSHKNHQIEATERILRESRELLGRFDGL